MLPPEYMPNGMLENGRDKAPFYAKGNLGNRFLLDWGGEFETLLFFDISIDIAPPTS